MPTTKVELDHRHKSLHWIVYLGHLEQGVGMCHKAGRTVSELECRTASLHLLCYPFQHGAFFEDEGGEGDSREVGARP